MNEIKGYFVAIFIIIFWSAMCVAFADTYYLTQEQLNSLSKQINNLQNSNKNMTELLQQHENKLNLQICNYEVLETNYHNKCLALEEQQKNYQSLLNKYKSRSSIYKYSIIGALCVGLIVGVIIVK